MCKSLAINRRLVLAIVACSLELTVTSLRSRAIAEPSSMTPVQPVESAAAYYLEAIRTMRDLPIPSSLRFRTRMIAQGAGVDVYDDDGVATMAVGYGHSFSHDSSWETELDASGESIVTTDDGHKQKTNAPVFNPTWAGAYDWLRYGVRGKPSNLEKSERSSSPATTTPDSNSALPTIAVIEAMRPSFYDVVDSGADICPSRAPGRHLHLIALRDPKTHPVTDVVVDTSSKRVCSLRFAIRGSSFVGATGSYNLDFGASNGYWLVTGGESDLHVRLFGIGAKRISLRFTNDFNPADDSSRYAKMHST